ncbi:MAG: hypothetical protein CL424_08365 [Acidimicrobiaceae bacterium]|nr:hypothetical protein [Acidimicrobiaceae bacterium]
MRFVARSTTVAPKPGVGNLLRLPAFRGLLAANVLSATVFGTSRFVFVWLVGELTDWNPATAILGIVIGLPPLFLSAWAGSLADYLPPKRLGAALFAISGVLFTVTATLIATGAMTVPLAMVTGFLAISAPSMLMPLVQALVPSVSPPEQLMQAVALQNLSMMMSTIGGIFLGGAVMQLFGTAAGFWLLVVASVLGFVVTSRAPLPTDWSARQRRADRYVTASGSHSVPNRCARCSPSPGCSASRSRPPRCSCPSSHGTSSARTRSPPVR